MAKKFNFKKAIGITAFIVLSATLAWGAGDSNSNFLRPLEILVNPGKLSQAHATLENECSACHTTVTGVEAGKCILCHANNRSLLQRQPTSFHANVQTCKECHLEHRGRAKRPTVMDHAVLTNIGLEQMVRSEEHTSELQSH